MDNNALDYDLALSVGDFFRLTDKQMNAILFDVIGVVTGWEKLADEIGISKGEQQLMGKAFTIRRK